MLKVKLSKIIFLSLILSTSPFVFADTPAETAAKREEENQFEGDIEGVKRDCGNRSVTIVFDWAAFDKLDFSSYDGSRGKAASKAVATINQSFTGEVERLGPVAMIGACKERGAKAKVSKITKILIRPQQKPADSKSVYKLVGTTLEVKVSPFESFNGDSFPDELLAKYL